MPKADNGHIDDNPKKTSQLDNDSSEVIPRLSKFYNEYISENISIPEDRDRIQNLIDEYCTDSFRKKIGSTELDADPFVDAQDYEEEWINNLSINKVENAPNKYLVCFILAFDNSQHCVVALVKKENDLWKIDNVIPAK